MNLESLNISQIFFEDIKNLGVFLKDATHLSRLKEIIMSGMSDLTDDIVKTAFHNSKIFKNNLQRVSLAGNNLISYKCLSYILGPKLLNINALNISYCNMFSNTLKFNSSEVIKHETPKVLTYIDMSNNTENSSKSE